MNGGYKCVDLFLAEFGFECADKRCYITLHKIKCCSFSVVFLPIKIKKKNYKPISKFKGACIGLFHHRENHTRSFMFPVFMLYSARLQVRVEHM